MARVQLPPTPTPPSPNPALTSRAHKADCVCKAVWLYFNPVIPELRAHSRVAFRARWRPCPLSLEPLQQRERKWREGGLTELPAGMHMKVAPGQDGEYSCVRGLLPATCISALCIISGTHTTKSQLTAHWSKSDR